MKSWIRMLSGKLRFKRLRSRFLAAMILITLPPLFILGYISYNIARNTLMETNSQTNADHLETSSEMADLLFRNLTAMNRSLVLNPEIRELLQSSNINKTFEPDHLSEFTSNRLQKFINNNVYDTWYVSSICLFNLDFQPYCAGRSDDAGIYGKADKAKQIEQTDWYKEAFESQGRVIFFGYNVLGDRTDTFSTVKLFRDAESPNGEPLGLLIVNVSKTIFKNVFTGGSEYGGFMALEELPDRVNVVYNDGVVKAELPSGNNLEQTLRRLEESGYLVSRYQNQTTNWTFVHLIKLEGLLKQSNKIGLATTLIASSIALLALIVSYFVSGSITRPLLQIKKMMVDWTIGTRSFAETFEDDEVGAIGETFKRMSSENKELIERLLHSELKEREAELRALQAQIKPHFLYNTLDSIYWMAILQNNQDIAQMAVSLSESFKLSLNKGKEMIGVFKELKHIEHYMTIQNIRYRNRFHYIQEIDPSLMGMEIMKLLLQPLVENAIYHGLEPKLGEGTIRLTGRIDGRFLLFIVEDDGIGMEDMGKTEQGYGLRNVRERLQLYYGPTSSLQIFSLPGEGTRIVIRFDPTQAKGGDESA